EVRWGVGEGGEACIERINRARNAREERAEIIPVGARHVLGVAELLHQVLPRTGVQLPAVQRLQRELARHRARTARLAHSRAIRPAISSALSIAAPPLLPALVAAPSSP